mgnify:FL=1
MMPEQNNFWNQNPQSDGTISPEQMSQEEAYSQNPGQAFTGQQAVYTQIDGQPSVIQITQGYTPGLFPQTSAITAVVLAALSFAMCGIFTAIPAVIMARKALDITDQVPNHPDAGTAKAAFILGWVNIVLFIIGILFWAFFIGLSVAFEWY